MDIDGQSSPSRVFRPFEAKHSSRNTTGTIIFYFPHMQKYSSEYGDSMLHKHFCNAIKHH